MISGMTNGLRKQFLIGTLLSTFWIQHAGAWGEKGHHLICQLASREVKESELKKFFKTRGHTLGHLCNIPDIYWRSLPKEQSFAGNPTHFFESDVVNIELKDVPLSLKEFVAKVAAKNPGESPRDLLTRTGTLWWRAEQFSQLATQAAQRASKALAPKENILEGEADAEPYSVAVYEMFVDMGLMGHFVGDVSMPYHNISDYDGYAQKHGGIHGYYETQCVGEYDDAELDTQVEAAVAKIPDYSKNESVVAVMKQLSVQAEKEVALVQKLDHILKPSVDKSDRHGLRKSVPAKRLPHEEGCAAFRPMIVKQLARSVKALAFFWDQIYAQGSRPKLERYRSFRYPLSPDFVPPSYIDELK